MNEINNKLEKIKKSCRTGKVVSNILCIIAIVGCVCALISGAAMFAGRADAEPRLVQLQDAGKIDQDHFSVYYIDLGHPEDWHSDIPALQNMIDEYPFTFSVATYCLLLGGLLAVTAVIMKLISLTFDTIEKEDSPFTDKVIRKVMTVMIFVSAILLMTAGMSQGVMGGLVTWVVYTVMDYGKTLQTESDETL